MKVDDMPAAECNRISRVGTPNVWRKSPHSKQIEIRVDAAPGIPGEAWQGHFRTTSRRGRRWLRPATEWSGRSPRGLTLVTQQRKEPPRALRHPRLVAATTHNYDHPSHNCSQERTKPSKRHTYSRCPHDVRMPDFCPDKATSWVIIFRSETLLGRSHPRPAARLALGPKPDSTDRPCVGGLSD